MNVCIDQRSSIVFLFMNYCFYCTVFNQRKLCFLCRTLWNKFVFWKYPLHSLGPFHTNAPMSVLADPNGPLIVFYRATGVHWHPLGIRFRLLKTDRCGWHSDRNKRAVRLLRGCRRTARLTAGCVHVHSAWRSGRGPVFRLLNGDQW